MRSKTLTLAQLLDLIELEDFRGIISKDEFLKTALEKGIPRMISDVRGAVRLAVEREGDGFSVIQYPTELANESINQIYPTTGNKRPENMNLDQAA